MNNIRKRIYGVLIIVIVLLIAAVSNILMDVLFTKLVEVTIDTNKLEEGKSIKLLQISDVHNKKSMNSNQQLVKLVQQAQPDMVVITGDLIDDNTKTLDNVFALTEQIAAVNPRVYFVTGNHEWRGGLAHELMEGLEARGIVVLDNKKETLKIDNSLINICGVSDWTSGQQDLDKALQGLDENALTIMLAHDPVAIYEYKEFIPDLTLSGHTHGGQVRLPLIGAVVAPGQGLFPELDKDFFNIKEDKILYIDSGVGTSVFPLRFLNRSQITLITIE